LRSFVVLWQQFRRSEPEAHFVDRAREAEWHDFSWRRSPYSLSSDLPDVRQFPCLVERRLVGIIKAHGGKKTPFPPRPVDLPFPNALNGKACC
jgi:hypothetical protein